MPRIHFEVLIAGYFRILILMNIQNFSVKADPDCFGRDKINSRCHNGPARVFGKSTSARNIGEL